MAPPAPTTKQKWLGYGLLGLICLFALLVAFVLGPALAEASGIAEHYVALALAAFFFVVALVCYTAVKIMTKTTQKDGKHG